MISSAGAPAPAYTISKFSQIMNTVVWIKPIGGSTLDERLLIELDGRKSIAVEKLNERLKADGYEFSRVSYMDLTEAPDFAACVR